MRILVRAAGLLAALFALSLLLSAFASVTNEDAVARLRLVAPIGQVAQALPAMVFFISADGRNIDGPACTLPADVDFRPIRRRMIFKNVMGSYLPFLVGLGKVFSLANASDGAATAPSATLEWNAELLQPDIVRLNRITHDMVSTNSDCITEIRHAFADGSCPDRISAVYRSEDQKNVLAVQFQTECFVPDETKEQPKLAPDVEHLSLIGRLKRSIGLIDVQYASPSVADHP